jgi:hypothetical protein
LFVLGACAFFLLLAASPAHAKIEEKDMPCEEGLCHKWWPKLPEVKGWHQEDASELNISAMAPDGFNLKDCKTVLYGNAVHKKSVPANKTMADFIENDKKGFSNASVTEESASNTKDGQEIKVYSFAPKDKEGKWERVGYGQEGDFYLIFANVAQTAKDLEKSKDAFKTLIESYKSKP